MKTVTEYTAGITIDGMALWSAGYILGALVGLLLGLPELLIFTGVSIVLFLGTRYWSIRKHGRKVNVSLSEELIVKLNK